MRADADDHFKLGDFGIARQLDGATGTLTRQQGTPVYMSPEMYHGELYDARTDQYSLGMVLYTLLNKNREPFLDVTQHMFYARDREEALKKRMDGEVLNDYRTDRLSG